MHVLHGCQTLFSEKIKQIITSLLSAELATRVVKVKEYLLISGMILLVSPYNNHPIFTLLTRNFFPANINLQWYRFTLLNCQILVTVLVKQNGNSCSVIQSVNLNKCTHSKWTSISVYVHMHKVSSAMAPILPSTNHLTLVLLNPDTPYLCKQCRSDHWLLKRPTDLDLHCLSLSIWICMNTFDK